MSILSKNGYIINKNKYSKDDIKKIRKELTVKPFVNNIYNKEIESYPVYKESEENLIVPKFYGIENFGKPKKNEEIKGEKIKIKFSGKLREKQQLIMDKILPIFKKDHGGTIVIGCGEGKTVLGLYLACHFKVKTLVISHKSFLLDQWKERIEEFTNASVGIIRQNKVDIENKDIVIGMLQSIAKEKYDYDFFQDFGLVIYDEAHHAPSKYFSRALPIINCKKTIALTATPKRKDKLEKVLYWFFGPIIYEGATKKPDKLQVELYKFRADHPKFAESINYRTKQVDFARTINRLLKVPKRTTFICNLLIENADIKERKILILSDRIKLLDEIKNKIDKLEKYDTDYYIGGMSQIKLKIAEDKQILFATYSMASEALDIPELNTLFMITPRKEVQQSVGRILRKKDHIVNPKIIDIVDQIAVYSRQGLHREKLYKSMNADIYENDVFETELIARKQIHESKDNMLQSIESESISACIGVGNKVNTQDIDFIDSD